MFNIFVVNDWHEIANVYIFADRFSSPYIVYPFFISANLLGVSILLNVLTAFFVGSFVTKIQSKNDNHNENTASLRLRMPSRQTRDSSEIAISTSTSQRRESDNNNETAGFHVFERQGYDTVIKTITGDVEDENTFAKKACELLQIFEKLTPTT